MIKRCVFIYREMYLFYFLHFNFQNKKLTNPLKINIYKYIHCTDTLYAYI